MKTKTNLDVLKVTRRAVSKIRSFGIDGPRPIEELEVLFEMGKDGLWSGYSDNYVRVSVEHDGNLSNQIRRVKITGTVADFAMGELCND